MVSVLTTKMWSTREKYGMLNLPVYVVEQLTDPVWLLPPVTCNDFDPPRKTVDNSLLMKQLYHQHVHEKHRESNHIYTDGSKSGEEVGCAVLYRGNLHSKKLANHSGIYNAELTAVLKAVKLAKDDTQAVSSHFHRFAKRQTLDRK